MKCPECNEESYVVDSRYCKGTRFGENYIRRRRECGSGHRFSTRENIEKPAPGLSLEAVGKMKKPALIKILSKIISDLNTEAA